MNMEKQPVEIGKFCEPSWATRFGAFPDKLEVPGYQLWHNYFLEARPPINFVSEQDHLKWLFKYYFEASDSEPIFKTTARPPLQFAFNQKPIPTSLFVNQPSAATRRDQKNSPLYTPFCPFSVDYGRYVKEAERNHPRDVQLDLVAFTRIVYMQLGVPNPVPKDQMARAAAKLRDLVKYPLFKLFNISRSFYLPIPIDEPHLNKNAVPDRMIKMTMLWHKLMVDFVIHHEVRLKMEKKEPKMYQPRLPMMYQPHVHPYAITQAPRHKPYKPY